jgi:hypothetical protein
MQILLQTLPVKHEFGQTEDSLEDRRLEQLLIKGRLLLISP